ncbi:hypothetical protein IT414_02475 [bacterium]|nr:hypothetical protein [bacterium]
MSHKKLQRAVQRAQSRDKKRQTKMKVSGKSVFTLAKLKSRPPGKS